MTSSGHSDAPADFPRAEQAALRRAELAGNLARIEQRLRAACAAAGRDRREVTLVAVSKGRPASDVALLADLGLCDFGENRDHEAAPKAAALPDLRWHFVGQLQTNKARSVASYADVVHSVDRPRLARALGRAVIESPPRPDAERAIEAFVQVRLRAHPAESMEVEIARGGARPIDIPALADVVAATPGLRLAGLMALAPLHGDPARAFAELATLGMRLRAAHPDARGLSAGMSGDLEQAIAAGATHVRVGTALFAAIGLPLR